MLTDTELRRFMALPGKFRQCAWRTEFVDPTTSFASLEEEERKQVTTQAINHANLLGERRPPGIYGLFWDDESNFLWRHTSGCIVNTASQTDVSRLIDQIHELKSRRDCQPQDLLESLDDDPAFRLGVLKTMPKNVDPNFAETMLRMLIDFLNPGFPYDDEPYQLNVGRPEIHVAIWEEVVATRKLNFPLPMVA